MTTQDRKPVAITFVVPAFNEERNIGATLDRINGVVGDLFSFEVIVVDNGSTDSTPAIARKQNAAVLVRTGCTIGALRNLGARQASGRYLVFLDADVHVTSRWINHLPARLTELEERPRTLMGSITGVPADASWIERSWFDPTQRNHRITHIGSGHLITTRAFFEELTGFDETLRTGEDYDLSARALAAGGQIIDAPDLYVEHLGYPSTLGRFVKREIWHGEGDFRSWKAVVSSKVALMTVAYVAAHLGILGAVVAGRWGWASALVLFVLLLCTVSSYVKYRGRPLRVITANAIIFYFYFAGRSAAMIKAIVGRASSRVAQSSARSANRRAIQPPSESG